MSLLENFNPDWMRLARGLGQSLVALDQGAAPNLDPLYQEAERERQMKALQGMPGMEGLGAAAGALPPEMLAQMLLQEQFQTRRDEAGRKAFEAAMGALGGGRGTPPPGGLGGGRAGATPPVGGLGTGGIREPVGAPPPPTPTTGLDPALVREVIRAESGGDPTAVSPKGATGIMQIMPATARDPGFGVPDIFTLAREMGRPVPDTSDATLQSLLRDAEVNQAFGERYLAAMSARYGGDTSLALAAYNAGPGRVDDAGGVPDIPETRNYVAGITGALAGGAPGTPAPSVMGPLGAPTGTPTPTPGLGGGARELPPEFFAAMADPTLPAGARAALEMYGEQYLREPPDRETRNDQYGVPRFVDTGEVAFPDAVPPPEAPAKADRADEPDGTADMQNYNFYAGQETAAGRTPKSFEEWRLTRAPRSPDATMTLPDGTVIQVGGDGTPDPTALGREVAKADVALRTEWRTAADGAANLSSLAEQAMALIPELGYTGIGGSILGTVRDTLGTEGTGARGAFERLTTDAQLQMSQLLKGAITDRENAMLRAATFSMDRQPEANQNIALAMKAAADRLVIRAEFGDRYLAATGGMEGAQAAWNRYINENPLFEVRDGTYVLFERAPFDNYIPPAVGAVVDGHVFKGGDPADQNNWEPVDGR